MKKEERKGNIAIVLFNPDRSTSKHVLTSFKKVPVFFLLTLRYVEKKARRKEKRREKEEEELF